MTQDKKNKNSPHSIDSSHQDTLRERWLMADLWSLYELACLCCGHLDHHGADPYSYIDWQQATGLRPENSKDQRLDKDRKDIEIFLESEEMRFAFKAIERAIGNEKLIAVYPPKNLEDNSIFGFYYQHPYIKPKEAIQWAKQQSYFPQFPFQRSDLKQTHQPFFCANLQY